MNDFFERSSGVLVRDIHRGTFSGSSHPSVGFVVGPFANACSSRRLTLRRGSLRKSLIDDRPHARCVHILTHCETVDAVGLIVV